MSNHERTLSELLFRWDELRQSGEERSVAELTRDCPELAAALRLRIDALRATDWLEPGAESRLSADGAFSSHELPDSNLSSNEFIERLSAIELLSAEELRRWATGQPGRSLPQDARSLAADLIRDGKLTRYQATVLLGGEPHKLLIDKYLVLDVIDAGGMGIVFKALHRPMDRIVALKMIAPHLLRTDERVQRFRREVRVAASLSHPNIVAAYDADEANGAYFLVMEYVEGRDLSRVVAEDGPLSAGRTTRAIHDAARGLAHAHRKGILHRDVKPGNLILSRHGTVKILDLGLALMTGDQLSHVVAAHDGDTVLRHPASADDLTQHGAVLGTAAYMAPEQARSTRSIDHRADIFSLGCTLHYLLIGQPPGAGVLPCLPANGDSPQSLRRLRPDIPEALDSLYQRMVASDPAQRPGSMDEVAANLLHLLDDSRIATESSLHDPPHSQRRARGAAAPEAGNQTPQPAPAVSQPANPAAVRDRRVILAVAASLALGLIAYVNWRSHSLRPIEAAAAGQPTESSADRSGVVPAEVGESTPRPDRDGVAAPSENRATSSETAVAQTPAADAANVNVEHPPTAQTTPAAAEPPIAASGSADGPRHSLTVENTVGAEHGEIRLQVRAYSQELGEYAMAAGQSRTFEVVPTHSNTIFYIRVFVGDREVTNGRRSTDEDGTASMRLELGTGAGGRPRYYLTRPVP